MSDSITGNTPDPNPTPATPQLTPDDLRARVATAVGEGYSAREITTALSNAPRGSFAFRVNDALAAGYSPEEIVDHLNPKADKINVQNIPVLAPVDRGIAHLRAAGANLADDLGYHGVASYVRQSIPTATLAAPTSAAALGGDLADGHYLHALTNLPSAALEGAAPVAGGIVAGAASGGSLPIMLATGGAIGALSQGDDIARARAANNGRAAPSASDLALGLAGGAATGAVGTVGLRGVGVPGIGAAVANTVRHAGADALQPELSSLAGSVGTTAGARNASASDMAASALTGLATRGALGTPDAIAGARAAYQASTPEGQRAAFDALSPEAAQRTLDAVQAAHAVQYVKDNAVLGPVSDQVAAPSAASLLADQVHTAGRTLDAGGMLPEGGRQAIGDAVAAAHNPAQTLLSTHLDGIRDLGLDPALAGHITGALRTVNLLTSPDFLTSRPGPVETVMRGFGSQAAGAALGSLAGPYGAVAGAVAGGAVKNAGGAVLGTLGRSIDSIAGFTTPSGLAQARNAAAMMDASGIQVPDNVGELASAMTASSDAIAAQRRLMDAQKAKDATDAQRFNLDYADAKAIDAMRTRGMNLAEMAGGQVAMMALRRAQAADALKAITTPLDASGAAPGASGGPSGTMAPTALPGGSEAMGSTSPAGAVPGVPDVVQQAINRARMANPAGALSDVVPGLDGLSEVAKAQGALLPEWQYGLGEKVKKALASAGTPKNLNTAQEVSKAIQALQGRGAFDPQFAADLQGHQGRIVRGLYNVIRNEMLLRHGIDMRTLAAQNATQPTPTIN